MLMRYPPPSGTREDPLARQLRENRRDFYLQYNFGYTAEPTYDVALRVMECIELLNEWEQFDHKLPYEGGYNEQPWKWKLRMSCALQARRDAQDDREAAEKDKEKTPVDVPMSDERGSV